MAALKKTDLLQFNTYGQQEGCDQDVNVNELYNMNDVDNDDDDVDICDIAPTDTTPGSDLPGHMVQTPTDSFHEFEPGSALHGETSISAETTDSCKVLPPIQRNAALDTINVAISSLQTEIYKSQQERRQSARTIEQQFAGIIEHLFQKQSKIIHQMNAFYDEQKQKSLNRISELKNELDEKELEIQIQKEKELEEQLQLQSKRDEEKEKVPPPSHYKRLSIFASKAKDIASAYIESWKNKDDKASEAQYAHSKRDQIRLFMPNELLKIITSDIKLSTEWWDALRLNRIVFNTCTHGALLWRTSAKEHGWYNAFGSIAIGKSQCKRWNIKICERIKQHDKATGKRQLQPADVVLGVIESDKRRSQDKHGGFWEKGSDGFGLYGWNGKIFHKKSRGKAYGNAFYAGSVIGIELNLHITPGMQLNGKIKPKLAQKYNAVGSAHGAYVKFYVDDSDFGVAFYDLNLNKEYSLAVALNSDVYSLQLMD